MSTHLYETLEAYDARSVASIFPFAVCVQRYTTIANGRDEVRLHSVKHGAGYELAPVLFIMAIRSFGASSCSLIAKDAFPYYRSLGLLEGLRGALDAFCFFVSFR